MERIERMEYLNKLIAFRDTQLVKIITGVRRCGKSTLMEMYADYLAASGVPQERIIAVNFENYDYIELTDPAKLYAYVKAKLREGEKTYIFFDEIQHVRDFPRVIDSLQLNKDIDIYITGSNAFMLSSEIATLISGRYVEIAMLPLSFKEYVNAVNGNDALSKSYLGYLQSSFPYALALKDRPNELDAYLSGVYSSIVLKDVVSRKRITDPMMLESLVRFAFDNIGSTLSTKKISDTMSSDGRKIDVKTVERYLSALTESYIIYQAERYNIKGRQHLKTLDKYYVVDIGLRYMLLGTRSTDVGHILENIVYLELIRRGYKVYIGKIDELEVDFVAMNKNGLAYYQIAATVRDSSTLERELAPLKRIPDNYPKLILTLDDDPPADYDGIRRINALDFLMSP